MLSNALAGNADAKKAFDNVVAARKILKTTTALFLKVHPHAAGAIGGNQDMKKTKGVSTPKYIWPWMRMVCRSESLLLKVQARTVSLQSNL